MHWQHLTTYIDLSLRFLWFSWLQSFEAESCPPAMGNTTSSNPKVLRNIQVNSPWWSWWFQPIWKILIKLDHLLKIKHLWHHHLVINLIVSEIISQLPRITLFLRYPNNPKLSSRIPYIGQMLHLPLVTLSELAPEALVGSAPTAPGREPCHDGHTHWGDPEPFWPLWRSVKLEPEDIRPSHPKQTRSHRLT